MKFSYDEEKGFKMKFGEGKYCNGCENVITIFTSKCYIFEKNLTFENVYSLKTDKVVGKKFLRCEECIESDK